MSRRERPPAVTRHCNSTLWLPLATIALFGWFFVTEDLPASRPERLDPVDEVAVVGRVVETKPGQALDVTYVHPVTEQRVTTDLYIWDGDLVPAPSGTIRLVVRRDDPLAAVAEGDVMPWHTNALVYGAWVIGALLPQLTRRFGVRRTERLMAAPMASFAMVGVLAPRRRRRFRCDLHLYPLDAPDGAPPVCSVPVLTTGQAAIGTRTFPVEVKGAPRPLGRVVARIGDIPLWPAGRAGRRADYPRLAGVPQPTAGLPPVATAPAPPPRSGLLSAVAAQAAFLVGAVVLVIVVVAVTASNGARARQLVSEGTPVIGEVIDHGGADDVVVLRYQRDGESHTAKAPADFASDFRKGIRYPARLDPTDPARARLLAEPYDAVEPVVWAVLPALALGGLTWSRWRNARRNLAAARQGPWFHALARAGTDPHDVILTDDEGNPVCGAIARQQGQWRPEPEHVVVGGPVEPGGPIAVRLPGGRWLLVVHPATNGVDVPKAGWAKWLR